MVWKSTKCRYQSTVIFHYKCPPESQFFSSLSVCVCVYECYLSIRDPHSLHLLLSDWVFDAAVPGIIGWIQVDGGWIRNSSKLSKEASMKWMTSCTYDAPYCMCVYETVPVNKWQQVFLSFKACSYNLRALRLELGIILCLMALIPCLLSGLRKMTMGYHWV